ncbi:MAG: GNAT family N-acetyltransferase [Pseudomonadota bacterium]
MKFSQNAQVDIRPARLADASRIAELFVQLDYPAAAAGLQARLQLQLADPGTEVLVAQDGGDLVGVLVMHVLAPLHVAQPWAVISALVVDDQRRSLGAGAALVAGAQQAALARDCAHMELSCSERRTRAHDFYSGLGFVEVRKRFKKPLGTLPPPCACGADSGAARTLPAP